MKMIFKILFLLLCLSPPPFLFSQIKVPSVNNWSLVFGADYDLINTKSIFGDKSNSQVFTSYGKTRNLGLPNNTPYWSFAPTWKKNFLISVPVPDSVFLDCKFLSGERNIKNINVFISFQSDNIYYFIGIIDSNKNIPMNSQWKALHWGEPKQVKEFGLIYFIKFYLTFQIHTEDSCYTGASIEVKNLRGKYPDGSIVIIDRFTDTTKVSVKMKKTPPDNFVLHQNYPNPFNPSTTIQFVVPDAGKYVLKVYNMLGQEVATLVDNDLSSGLHKVNFDANNLSSGIYLYKLAGSKVNLSKKMILRK
jgi:hypothetical protein